MSNRFLPELTRPVDASDLETREDCVEEITRLRQLFRDATYNYILITGANRGLGKAIACAVLKKDKYAYAILGARDVEKGRKAVKEIALAYPNFDSRMSVLALDVTDETSIQAALGAVVARFSPLYAIVNNAGVGPLKTTSFLKEILDVNFYGVKRICEAFLPCLHPTKGRIVNVTSAAAAMYLDKCNEDTVRMFLNPHTTWEELEGFVHHALELKGSEKLFEAEGIGNGLSYALSKACANLYTLQIAEQYPRLRINACTPGFLNTDLTKQFAIESGKTPKDMGMKTPAEGTKSTLMLLYEGSQTSTTGSRRSGLFYGSDGKRNPLHTYRNAGDPEYAGEKEVKLFPSY